MPFLPPFTRPPRRWNFVPQSSGEISSPLEILRTVDAISNTVCSVIDAADFLRNAHADQRFRDAADEAFSQLAEYIQVIDCARVSALWGCVFFPPRIARVHRPCSFQPVLSKQFVLLNIMRLLAPTL